MRDGTITLANAYLPDLIIDTKNGRNGRASFKLNGRNLNPVFCRVRVEQPDVGLCGEADMVARLTEQAAQPGSRTEQRVQELKKLIGE